MNFANVCAVRGLTGRSRSQQMEEQRAPRRGRTEVTIIAVPP